MTKYNPMRTSEGLFKLVYKDTNVKVTEGTIHKSFRGEVWKFEYPLPPHKPSSEGKVSMILIENGVESDWNQVFYPSVFGLEFVKV